MATVINIHKKRKRGRRLGSGTFDKRLPGIPVKKELFDMLEQLAEEMSMSLTAVTRFILEREAPSYLEKFKR